MRAIRRRAPLERSDRGRADADAARTAPSTRQRPRRSAGGSRDARPARTTTMPAAVPRRRPDHCAARNPLDGSAEPACRSRWTAVSGRRARARGRPQQAPTAGAPSVPITGSGSTVRRRDVLARGRRDVDDVGRDPVGQTRTPEAGAAASDHRPRPRCSRARSTSQRRAHRLPAGPPPRDAGHSASGPSVPTPDLSTSSEPPPLLGQPPDADHQPVGDDGHDEPDAR